MALCAPARARCNARSVVTPSPLRTRAPVAPPVGLRLREAARSLGVSVRTVQRLIADGRLPASRIGRTVVVEARALVELLAQTRIGGGE